MPESYTDALKRIAIRLNELRGIKKKETEAAYDTPTVMQAMAFPETGVPSSKIATPEDVEDLINDVLLSFGRNIPITSWGYGFTPDEIEYTGLREVDTVRGGDLWLRYISDNEELKLFVARNLLQDPGFDGYSQDLVKTLPFIQQQLVDYILDTKNEELESFPDMLTKEARFEAFVDAMYSSGHIDIDQANALKDVGDPNDELDKEAANFLNSFNPDAVVSRLAAEMPPGRSGNLAVVAYSDINRTNEKERLSGNTDWSYFGTPPYDPGEKDIAEVLAKRDNRWSVDQKVSTIGTRIKDQLRESHLHIEIDSEEQFKKLREENGLSYSSEEFHAYKAAVKELTGELTKYHTDLINIYAEHAGDPDLTDRKWDVWYKDLMDSKVATSLSVTEWDRRVNQHLESISSINAEAAQKKARTANGAVTAVKDAWQNASLYGNSFRKDSFTEENYTDMIMLAGKDLSAFQEIFIPDSNGNHSPQLQLWLKNKDEELQAKAAEESEKEVAKLKKSKEAATKIKESQASEKVLEIINLNYGDYSSSDFTSSQLLDLERMWINLGDDGLKRYLDKNIARMKLDKLSSAFLSDPNSAILNMMRGLGLIDPVDTIETIGFRKYLEEKVIPGIALDLIPIAQENPKTFNLEQELLNRYGPAVDTPPIELPELRLMEHLDIDVQKDLQEVPPPIKPTPIKDFPRSLELIEGYEKDKDIFDDFGEARNYLRAYIQSRFYTSYGEISAETIDDLAMEATRPGRGRKWLEEQVGKEGWLAREMQQIAESDVPGAVDPETLRALEEAGLLPDEMIPTLASAGIRREYEPPLEFPESPELSERIMLLSGEDTDFQRHIIGQLPTLRKQFKTYVSKEVENRKNKAFEMGQALQEQGMSAEKAMGYVSSRSRPTEYGMPIPESQKFLPYLSDQKDALMRSYQMTPAYRDKAAREAEIETLEAQRDVAQQEKERRLSLIGGRTIYRG